MRGNWASFLHIPYPSTHTKILMEQVSNAMKKVDVEWCLSDDLHITLSRTVSIPHHFIAPLFDQLKQILKDEKGFSANVQPSIKVYTNDEKTRTFLGLELDETSGYHLKNIVNKADTVLKRFSLEEYYENPSFHISFAWACGDVTSDRHLCSDLSVLKSHITNIFERYPELFNWKILSVSFKTGDKLMKVKLADID